jgi:hypothetical protein
MLPVCTCCCQCANVAMDAGWETGYHIDRCPTQTRSHSPADELNEAGFTSVPNSPFPKFELSDTRITRVDTTHAETTAAAAATALLNRTLSGTRARCCNRRRLDQSARVRQTHVIARERASLCMQLMHLPPNCYSSLRVILAPGCVLCSMAQHLRRPRIMRVIARAEHSGYLG